MNCIYNLFRLFLLLLFGMAAITDAVAQRYVADQLFKGSIFVRGKNRQRRYGNTLFSFVYTVGCFIALGLAVAVLFRMVLQALIWLVQGILLMAAAATIKDEPKKKKKYYN